MKNLKFFVIECLLFQKPFEGSVIPNWMLSVVSWFNILIIISAFIRK